MLNQRLMPLENPTKMLIRIGKLRIDTVSRKEKHYRFLLNEIMDIRNEIIDIVMTGHANNRISVKELKLKAGLIKKYSRRIRLLNL
jgi:hypothetical protein|tara:strand:- start:1261 stop:1518 length:258 start_codon:yes stop_codon:yes gene_type:complete